MKWSKWNCLCSQKWIWKISKLFLLKEARHAQCPELYLYRFDAALGQKESQVFILLNKEKIVGKYCGFCLHQKEESIWPSSIRFWLLFLEEEFSRASPCRISLRLHVCFGHWAVSLCLLPFPLHGIPSSSQPCLQKEPGLKYSPFPLIVNRSWQIPVNLDNAWFTAFSHNAAFWHC